MGNYRHGGQSERRICQEQKRLGVFLESLRSNSKPSYKHYFCITLLPKRESMNYLRGVKYWKFKLPGGRKPHLSQGDTPPRLTLCMLNAETAIGTSKRTITKLEGDECLKCAEATVKRGTLHDEKTGVWRTAQYRLGKIKGMK